jgi:hypothetical protein
LNLEDRHACFTECADGLVNLMSRGFSSGERLNINDYESLWGALKDKGWKSIHPPLEFSKAYMAINFCSVKDEMIVQPTKVGLLCMGKIKDRDANIISGDFVEGRDWFRNRDAFKLYVLTQLELHKAWEALGRPESATEDAGVTSALDAESAEDGDNSDADSYSRDDRGYNMCTFTQLDPTLPHNNLEDDDDDDDDDDEEEVQKRARNDQFTIAGCATLKTRHSSSIGDDDPFNRLAMTQAPSPMLASSSQSFSSSSSSLLFGSRPAPPSSNSKPSVVYAGHKTQRLNATNQYSRNSHGTSSSSSSSSYPTSTPSMSAPSGTVPSTGDSDSSDGTPLLLQELRKAEPKWSIVWDELKSLDWSSVYKSKKHEFMSPPTDCEQIYLREGLKDAQKNLQDYELKYGEDYFFHPSKIIDYLQVYYNVKSNFDESTPGVEGHLTRAAREQVKGRANKDTGAKRGAPDSAVKVDESLAKKHKSRENASSTSAAVAAKSRPPKPTAGSKNTENVNMQCPPVPATEMQSSSLGFVVGAFLTGISNSVTKLYQGRVGVGDSDSDQEDKFGL